MLLSARSLNVSRNSSATLAIITFATPILAARLPGRVHAALGVTVIETEDEQDERQSRSTGGGIESRVRRAKEW